MSAPISKLGASSWGEILRRWIGTLSVLVIALFLIWLYSSTNSGSAAARALRNSIVQVCDRQKQQNRLIVAFMDQAAIARQSSASSTGSPAARLNDQRAADRYRALATAYASLAPADCNVAYPAP